MASVLREHAEFFRQFRQRFKTTGAVAPSSRFLARALTRPLRERTGCARILEVGPGTGAVTRSIVDALGDDDRLDLVELNETFAQSLRNRFQTDDAFRKAAGQSEIHVCRIEEFRPAGLYDFIISGLPLNNFTPESVRNIFDVLFGLLAPEGVLSFFEYMFVRRIRGLAAARAEQGRLRELEAVIGSYLETRRFRCNWVFLNIPPAWAQHLRHEPGPPSAET